MIDHSTKCRSQLPVAVGDERLAERHFKGTAELSPGRCNSCPGQAVYEPFMGSGTTLIAAEATGRVCHGIELNPAYVRCGRGALAAVHG